jgi:hypothetical protein
LPKTCIDIHRLKEIKIMSAQKGITLTKFINDAIEEKLRRETSQVKLETFARGNEE